MPLFSASAAARPSRPPQHHSQQSACGLSSTSSRPDCRRPVGAAKVGPVLGSFSSRQKNISPLIPVLLKSSPLSASLRANTSSLQGRISPQAMAASPPVAHQASIAGFSSFPSCKGAFRRTAAKPPASSTFTSFFFWSLSRDDPSSLLLPSITSLPDGRCASNLKHAATFQPSSQVVPGSR